MLQSIQMFTHGCEVYILQIVQYVVNACKEPLECGGIH